VVFSLKKFIFFSSIVGLIINILIILYVVATDSMSLRYGICWCIAVICFSYSIYDNKDWNKYKKGGLKKHEHIKKVVRKK
jgi:hypothetical protein